MSVTYQSPTYHWSSENEHNVISYSANSETDSSPIKQHPLSQPPQEFINALQTKGHYLNPTTTHHYHQSQYSILEPIVNHDLSRLLNITQPLLIDVRSAFHYSENHIKSAIHIAIPSVLLKRSTYTLDKIIQSLNGSDANRFKQWSATTHIIFYDHTSNNDSGYSATAILLALKLKQLHYQGHLAYLQGRIKTAKS
jgi:protein-tyrosine phosphatase